MTTLKVTAKGQVTLKKELLKHLGVAPGQKIEVARLPNKELSIKSALAERTGSWDDFIGILAGKTNKVATIEEMNEAIARGWAGLHEHHGRYESSGEDGNEGQRAAGTDRPKGGHRR